MSKVIFWICSVSLLFLNQQVFSQRYRIPTDLKDGDYAQNILLIKIKKEHIQKIEKALSGSGPIFELLSKKGGGTIRPNFQNKLQISSTRNLQSPKRAELTRIYQVQFFQNIDLYETWNAFDKSGFFEWVQPRFTATPLYSPNDPLVNQQYHHSLIKTFEAWDIEKGDSNIIIGYTDSGIQFDHQDLGNVKYNYKDPVNGLDDDMDGYIDNFRGWNVAEDSNDPTAKKSEHGMFTAGLGSAVVDNSTGISGVGFACKFIPIRIDNSNGAFNYGYEGITYAADMGYPIINASWGSTRYDPLGEDVINYAQERNCLIVAAAGNSGKNEKYYPASFPGVFSVAASNASDVKWSGSTYGEKIDLIAPGENLFSTGAFNKYKNSSGTSFSAPLVSAAAALVKSKFPNLTPAQIKARLKNTADTSIYNIPANAIFHDLLGSGRLNIHRALTDQEKPSIHYSIIDFHDSDKDRFSERGDTIKLEGYFENILAPTKNLRVELTCSSPFIEIISAEFDAGIINTGQKKWNLSNPFAFKIAENTPYNHDFFLKFNYLDSGYASFEFIEFRVNKDYIELHNNRVGTTITSRGNTGFNEDFASDGTGFTHNSKQLIYYSGFMVGTSSKLLADNAYASKIPGYDRDFERINGVQILHPESESFRTVYSSFKTDSAANQPLLIKHRATAYKEKPDDHYIMLEYTLKNIGQTKISDLHAGIFTDWDIESSNNKAVWDSANQISYAFNLLPDGPYGGICRLAGPVAQGYSFNSNGKDSSICLTDGFSGSEKFLTLSGQAKRIESSSGDIANLISSKAFNLEPGDSILIAYAMIAADSLNELLDGSRKARARYNLMRLKSEIQTHPVSCNKNPGSLRLKVNPKILDSIKISKIDGTIILKKEKPDDTIILDKLEAGDYSIQYSFYDKSSIGEAFSIDTLQTVKALAESSEKFAVIDKPTIQFYFKGNGADNFSWDFDDGNTSNLQNPSHTYQKEGLYNVRLIASNKDCADTTFLEIQIVSTVGNENFQVADLSMYPNPASQILTIQSDEIQTGLSFRIYEITGRQTLAGQINPEKPWIDISNLPESIYLIQFYNHHSITNRTLVISR